MPPTHIDRPEKAVKETIQEILRLERTLEIIEGAAVGRPERVEIRNFAAASVMIKAGLALESCFSEVLLNLLQRFPTPFYQDLERQIIESVRRKQGDEAAKHLKFGSRPATISRDKARALKDRNGRNITVESAEDLIEEIRHLATIHFTNPSWTKEDKDLVDLAVVFRNYFAHESESSKKRLQDVLNAASKVPPNDVLVGRISAPYNYILAKIGAKARGSLILIRIADVLRLLDSDLSKIP